jgi:hypothetical protein
MDRVSNMTKELDAMSVYFMKFMRYANDIARTVCFFEGEDQKYFVARLDGSKIKSNWCGIDCGGKKNVLNLYIIIANHDVYKSSRVAFFVDRDFDEPITLEMRDLVYETPSYSIENFYCTDHCLSRVLNIEYKLDKDPNRPELITHALENFQAMRRQFQIAIRPLNVWIKAHQTKEKMEGLKALNLPNVSLEKFIEVRADSIISTYTLDDMQSFFPDCYTLSEDELKLAEESLPIEESHLNFRGKYQLEFVRKYLDNLKKACIDKTSHFYNPGNTVKLSISKINIISELSQYASTPDCLSEFLAKLVPRPSPVP